MKENRFQHGGTLCAWRSLILALLGCILVACGGGESAQVMLEDAVTYSSTASAVRTDFVSYNDAEYGFEMQLPREWYIGELDNPDNTYGVVVASSNDPAQPRAAITILVEPLAANAEIEQAANGAETVLREQAGIAEFRRDLARPATVNELAGQERWYSYQLDGAAVRQRTVFLNGGDQVFAISLIAPQDLYAQHETLFTDILSTFRL